MTISFNRVQGHKQNNMNLLQIPFSEWNKSMVWTDTGVLWLESEVITFKFCLSCAKENTLERSLDSSFGCLSLYFSCNIITFYILKQNKTKSCRDGISRICKLSKQWPWVHLPPQKFDSAEKYLFVNRPTYLLLPS